MRTPWRQLPARYPARVTSAGEHAPPGAAGAPPDSAPQLVECRVVCAVPARHCNGFLGPPRSERTTGAAGCPAVEAPSWFIFSRTCARRTFSRSCRSTRASGALWRQRRRPHGARRTYREARPAQGPCARSKQPVQQAANECAQCAGLFATSLYAQCQRPSTPQSSTWMHDAYRGGWAAHTHTAQI